MAVVPANELRCRDIAEIGPGGIQWPVMRCAGRQHHRVVKAGQFGNGDILTDREVATEMYVFRLGHAGIAPRHALDRLVIGGHPLRIRPWGTGSRSIMSTLT